MVEAIRHPSLQQSRWIMANSQGLREVVYPQNRGGKSSGISCPKCNGTLYYGFIPCPDGKPGCAVAHYGYTCGGCGAVFVKSALS